MDSLQDRAAVIAAAFKATFCDSAVAVAQRQADEADGFDMRRLWSLVAAYLKDGGAKPPTITAIDSISSPR